FTRSDGFGISNDGWIVGDCGVSGQANKATLWTNGETYDLNTLVDKGDWIQLQYAYAINANHIIVGRGRVIPPFNGLDDGVGFSLTPLRNLVSDVDCDFDVDADDLGAILNAWGSSDDALDIDENGTVDGSDLGILLSEWTSGD